MPKTRPIVIVGGGFGGLQAALHLDRFYGADVSTPIYLIDPSPYHIYTPSLYAVANAHSPRVAVIPFTEILEGTHIHFIQEKVTHIDGELKVVTTEHRQLPYEDLVVAVGSQAKRFKDAVADPDDVFFVKTIDDVLKIRTHIEKCVTKAKAEPGDTCHRHFVVAGAGPTGVEFAGSLAQFLKMEAKLHKLSPKNFKITLVDAGDRILGRIDPGVSRLAQKYLKSQGVNVKLNTKVSWEEREKLRMNKDVIDTETLIWTVGVMPHSLLMKIKSFRRDEHDHIIVDGSLQAIDNPRVWVVGDAAAVADAGLALSAVAHGRHVAKAIRSVRHGDIPEAYQPNRWPAVFPLSDDYGVAQIGKSVFDGWWVILYKKWIDLRYYLSILPIPWAFQLMTARGCVVKEGKVYCAQDYTFSPQAKPRSKVT